MRMLTGLLVAMAVYGCAPEQNSAVPDSLRSEPPPAVEPAEAQATVALPAELPLEPMEQAQDQEDPRQAEFDRPVEMTGPPALPVPEPDEAETPRALDLSLLYNAADDPWTGDESIRPPYKGFDPKPLFAPDEKPDSEVSFSVVPNFKETEVLTEMPELDGGSISIEVKTK